jgi:hypothetical protein
MKKCYSAYNLVPTIKLNKFQIVTIHLKKTIKVKYKYRMIEQVKLN